MEPADTVINALHPMLGSAVPDDHSRISLMCLAIAECSCEEMNALALAIDDQLGDHYPERSSLP